jgi:hypothetical protein
MDELVKQEIDYASYTKMNRVEKQATAAALGMNVDQMAKFVSQQELARKLNIDMAAAENQTSEGLERSLKSNQERIAQMAALGDETAKQYERDNEALTTQEKMNKLVDMMISGFKFLGPVLVGIGVAMTIIGLALLKAAIAAAGLTSALSGGFNGRYYSRYRSSSRYYLWNIPNGKRWYCSFIKWTIYYYRQIWRYGSNGKW